MLHCCNLLLNVAILNDVTLARNRADLQQAFDKLLSWGPEVGLHINPQKSLVWCGDGGALPLEVDISDPLK